MPSQLGAGGRGLQAMADIEWDAFHNRILVRDLPDEDSLETLARKLSDLVMDRRLEGVSGMTNLSTR